MPKANEFLAIERCLAAQRWERCRAAYFLRVGKPDNAAKCQRLAEHHRHAASEQALMASRK